MRTVYDADLLLVDDNPDLLRLLEISSLTPSLEGPGRV